MKRRLVIAAMIFLLTISGISEAVIKDGAIRGRSGLSFKSISYTFKNLSVTIRNSTKSNVNFGGTMIFLDKNYRVIAKAELMMGKIKRHSSRRYRGFFSYGTGEEAKNARYVEWEF